MGTSLSSLNADEGDSRRSMEWKKLEQDGHGWPASFDCMSLGQYCINVRFILQIPLQLGYGSAPMI